MRFQNKARKTVLDYYNNEIAKDGIEPIKIEDVFVVWFSKTLQNWKAIISTTVHDQRIYEVTYNGDKKETYLDAYKKEKNVHIPDAEEANAQSNASCKR